MRRQVKITEATMRTLREPGLYRDGALLVRVSRGGTASFCVQIDARRGGKHVSKRRKCNIERAALIAKGIEGKRLTYRPTH